MCLCIYLSIWLSAGLCAAKNARVHNERPSRIFIISVLVLACDSAAVAFQLSPGLRVHTRVLRHVPGRCRNSVLCLSGLRMSANEDGEKPNPILAGLVKMWDASMGAVGGSGVDFRSADERPPEEKPTAEVEDETLMNVDDPDMISPLLLVSLVRLQNLLAEHHLTPASSRELESLHVLVVSELVTHAKEARPFLALKYRNFTLPASHVAALRFASDCRTAREGKLSSALKWIPKKLGLNPLISVLAKDEPPVFPGERELLAMCRDIERAVSETLIVAGTCAMVPDDSTRTDFLETIRPILEHTATKDRHQALLAISGYFRAHTADAGVLRRPLPTITSAWKKSFPNDFICAVSPARAALPFLLVAARQDALAAVQADGGARNDSAALTAVDAADAACVHVVARLLEADSAGYTLGAIQQWAAAQAVEATIDLSDALTEDRKEMKLALAAKMLRVAQDGGWDATNYSEASRNALVADVIATVGNDVTTGALASPRHCVLARAIFAAPVGLEGRALVRFVEYVYTYIYIYIYIYIYMYIYIYVYI